MKAPPPLPINAILWHAILSTYRRLPDLFKVSSPFVFMLMIMSIFTETYMTPALAPPLDGVAGADTLPAEEMDVDSDLMLLYLLLAIPSIAASIMSACACHRIFLLKTPDIRMFHWSKREWRFLHYCFIVMGILMAVGVFVVVPFVFFIGQLMVLYFGDLGGFDFVSVLVILALFYLFNRMVFVFPAAAVGLTDVSLRRSWRMTRTNGWRLVFLTGIIPLNITLIDIALPAAFDDSIVWSAISFALYIPLIPFNVCLLSSSYAYLSGEGKEEEDGDDNNGNDGSAAKKTRRPNTAAPD